MTPDAELVLRLDPSKRLPLLRTRPTTIGRAASNRLRLASDATVADHHAVVRFSRGHGWLVCDWQSRDGTYLEGQRIRQCRPLSDGDEIQLGAQGPVLIFRMLAAAKVAAPDPGSGAPPPSAATAAPTSNRSATAGGALNLAGRQIPRDQIRSAHVRSRPLYPHSFSWWVLLSLGAMVLLPWPWLFWSLEIGALTAWILLGSRKEHELVVNLRDGMAHRHVFTNRITALSHRNGIRKAIGQSLDTG